MRESAATPVPRRLALLVPSCVLSALTFALLHLVPGDPVALVLDAAGRVERMAACEVTMGWLFGSSQSCCSPW